MYKKSMAILFAGSAAAALTLAAPANAAGGWAAIAYSPEKNIIGTSFAPNKQHANDLAMMYCYQFGGTDCQVAAINQDGCVALALSDTNWHGGYGYNIAEASGDAIISNGGGNIIGSVCSQ